MNLEAVVSRLQARADALRFVGVVADFASAQDDLKQYPAAYVLPVAEEAGPNELTNGLMQRVIVRFAVMFAVRNVSDAGGKASLAELRDVRLSAFEALLNWTPEDASSPISFGGGEIAGLSDSFLWWKDEFETETYLRSV